MLGRPADFTEKIITNWERKVKPEDLVIHLGDVSWGDLEIDKLPGIKVLIKGNHDKMPNSWYQKHGFAFVCESCTIFYGGLHILFTHKPRLFHEADVDVCGHMHGIAVVDTPSPILALSLEKDNYDLIDMATLKERADKCIIATKTRHNNLTQSYTLFPEVFYADYKALQTIADNTPVTTSKYLALSNWLARIAKSNIVKEDKHG